jgi:hypothetical protein
MRFVLPRRLLLAGLMASTAFAAAQAPANAASTSQSCGPTYSTRTALGSAPWPGSSVPWHSVGKGWILGIVSAKQSGTGPQTLYLVSPRGQRYKLGSAPAGATLQDWSGASMDALFTNQPDSGTKATVIVLNLKTGQASGFTVYSPLQFPEISFSHPSGGILLLASHDSSGGYLPLQRYSLTGTRQICYPNSFRGAGSGAFEYRESPAGPDVVLQTKNGLEVMSNSGHPVRFLPQPHGYSYCAPLNWWNSQTILATCSNNSSTTLAFAFPLSGAKPTAVTTAKQSSTFLGIWRIPSGTYAQEAACGSSWLEHLNANGTGTQLLIPGATNAGNVEPLGTYGNELPLWVTGGCDGHTPYSKVDWYSPSANKATTVLGASAGGGFVMDALLYPSN